MPTIRDVKEYWEDHPLLSYELKDAGSEEFFDELDRLKREDSDRFSLGYWDFGSYTGKKLIDVGCGPGWLAVNYALGGADVYAVDLTRRAAEITQLHKQYKHASVSVYQASAEALPFEDGCFDVVVSSGVLHHTPDTYKAIRECSRVLKPGGTAKITLYYKGILHWGPIYSLTRSLISLLSVRHPGSDLKKAKNADDFIRQYDGAANPVGIGKNAKEWGDLFEKAGLHVLGYSLHFFPKRFFPMNRFMPIFAHYLFDKYLGTMVYFDVKKNA